jgi:hypothetical protein
MSTERNKTRALELLDRLLNGHDVEALGEYTSNPAILGAGAALVRAFPDLEGQVNWAVAEGDTVVIFHDIRGTQHGPWLFIQHRPGDTSRRRSCWLCGSTTTAKSPRNGSAQTSSTCSTNSAGSSPPPATSSPHTTDPPHRPGTAERSFAPFTTDGMRNYAGQSHHPAISDGQGER